MYSSDRHIREYLWRYLPPSLFMRNTGESSITVFNRKEKKDHGEGGNMGGT